MVTNTYLPMVGGVARSVASFTEEFRRRGHRVLVVAPTYEHMPAQEQGVLRVPAIQNFNGSDFSVRLPVPVALSSVFDKFQPDIVHTHHPFLLGDTALRIASMRSLPVVFTHHTMYEQYTHYVPGGATALKGFVAQLATEYANLCDHVIAPSASVAAVLRKRQVTTPVTAIPTGIDPKRFARGSGQAARQRLGIPPEAFVVGHVGRLAPEKNLGFLARAVAAFVESDERACFLVVGGGPAEGTIRSTFEGRGRGRRLFLAGPLEGRELADAYHAMDAFAFASQTETQGMVLAEAMTAGVPAVALDAPGAREMVRDGANGRLLPGEDAEAFAQALAWVAGARSSAYRSLVRSARATAEEFALGRCAGRVLDLYGSLVRAERRPRPEDDNPWTQTLRLVEAEWKLWGARVGAAVKAIVSASL
jgi:glycosyltransferase involved in cell wall biosynthesis